jgi:hypothetical protein
MKIYDDNYELATGVEVDELLSELPMDLMKENLKCQIQDPLSTTSNYLNIIIEKYTVLKDNFDDDEVSMQKIKATMEDVFAYVLNLMDDTYELDLDEVYDFDDLLEMTDNLYTFLILHFRSNVSNFFYEFIIENKKNLVDYYEKLGKKKDVTTLNLKKQIKSKDDIIILANLPSITNYIKNLYVEPLEFLNYITDDDNYEGKYVKDLILHNKLTGNFVNNYLNIIFDENDNVLDEIQVEIKIQLFSKTS